MEQLVDAIETGDRIGDGGRNALRAKKDCQLVFVLTQLDYVLLGKKEVTWNLAPHPRDRFDVRVAVRNHEVHLFPFHDMAQGIRKPGMGGRGNQVVSIRRRLLEDKPIRVAADEKQGRIACPQTSDQIVALSGPGTTDEESLVHGPPGPLGAPDTLTKGQRAK
jgi:hypothetical protein